MNQEVKQKWLDALRSGEYDQNKGCLREGNKFCCLGVLSDIHAKETGTEWNPYHTRNNKAMSYLNESGGLPKEVQKWAGLDNLLPRVKDSEITLSQRNDGGWSFEQIADEIEVGL